MPVSKLPKYIRFEKEVGDTPLQALNRLKQLRPELTDVRLAYAGRLDPQASGELLILVGEECKHRDHYQNLDKIYTFELLCGFSTDTGDIMGELVEIAPQNSITEEQLKSALDQLTTTFWQEYPAYSSKAVDGKPLWKWAKEGRLEEIEMPKHEITIYSSELISTQYIKRETLFHDIADRIEKVEGDFRQSEIIEDWKIALESCSEVTTFKIRVKVSSGTYIRQLASNISEKVGVPFCCLNIHRDTVLLSD